MSSTVPPPSPLADTPLAGASAAPATADLQGDQPAVSVLHLVNGEHFSGAERVQSHLGRCLPNYGVTADFACLKPGLFAQHLRQAETTDQPIGRGFDAPMRGRFDLRVLRPLKRIVNEQRYDLLHAHTPRTAMVAAMLGRLTGTPWVYHVHSPAARDSSRWLQNRLNAWIEAASLRSCSHLITVSDSLRRDMLQSGWSAERVTTVHNGVPCIRPPREAVPRPNGRWMLGMVALMRPRKGLEIALQALRILVAAGHDVHLRCIGPFETNAYRDDVLQLVSELGLEERVEFTGFAQDVPRALAKLDALVLPSLYGEGLPMVVLEAMAAALPVVATEVEGTPEAIRDGQEGLLAQPASSHSLAAKIELLVGGKVDWSAMAEAACQRHRDHFSDQAMAAATAAVYQRTLDSGV